MLFEEIVEMGWFCKTQRVGDLGNRPGGREIEQAASKIEIHGARYPQHMERMTGL